MGLTTLHSQWADLSTRTHSHRFLHGEHSEVSLSLQQSPTADSAAGMRSTLSPQDSTGRASRNTAKGAPVGDSWGIAALDGIGSKRVKDFSVDDILAETASLVSIPTDLDDADGSHFGGLLPNAPAWSLHSATSSGEPPARRAAYEQTDSLIADADSMTELRVENVALRARVGRLEEELAKYQSMASSSALAQTQYVHNYNSKRVQRIKCWLHGALAYFSHFDHCLWSLHGLLKCLRYQKLSNVLRVRNSELETQVSEISAKLAQHSRSVGKLNDLILRQDSALKHVRKSAARKVQLAKKKVQSADIKCQELLQDSLDLQKQRHLDAERQLIAKTRFLQGAPAETTHSAPKVVGSPCPLSFSFFFSRMFGIGHIRPTWFVGCLNVVLNRGLLVLKTRPRGRIYGAH